MARNDTMENLFLMLEKTEQQAVIEYMKSLLSQRER